MLLWFRINLLRTPLPPFSKTQCYVPDNKRKRESLLIMTEFIALDVFIAYSYFCCFKSLNGAWNYSLWLLCAVLRCFSSVCAVDYANTCKWFMNINWYHLVENNLNQKFICYIKMWILKRELLIKITCIMTFIFGFFLVFLYSLNKLTFFLNKS